MFASGTGSMRGPRVKTPLLLLLLLLTTLTRTVLCQYDDNDAETAETPEGEEAADPQPEDGADPENSEISPTVSDASSAPTVDPAHAEEDIENPIAAEPGSGRSLPPDGEVIDTTMGPYYTGSTTPMPEDEGLILIIILIPVVLVVLIIGMIVCGIVINRRWNQKARSQELRKEDPYLDGSSSEKVPMPMFEEDVPSVLELEMEELDQWMKKDGETAEDSNHA